MSLPQPIFIEFNEIIDECKDSPELHQEKLCSAHGKLLELKKTYPSNAEIYDLLGRISCLLELREDALTYHKAATQLEGFNWRRWFNFGVTVARFGEYEEAIKHYKEALSLNPPVAGLATTSAYLAVNYYKAHQIKAAIETLDKVLELQIDSENTTYLIDNILRVINPKRMDARTLEVLGSLEYCSLALKKASKLSSEISQTLLNHTKDYLSLVKDKATLAFKGEIDFKDIEQDDLRESFERFQNICYEMNVLPVFDENFDFGVAYDLPARS